MMDVVKISAKIKVALFLGLVLPLLAGGIGAVWAFQSPDADVDFYLVPPPEEKPLTVGDRITLRLEVNHPSDSQVALPQLDEQWGDFEVVAQTPAKTVRNGDGTFVTGKDIVISLFEPGQYETPRLLVTHQKADGSTEELAAPVIPLQIQSILVEGDTELRDLKPQAILPVPPLWPWLLAGFMLFSLLLGAVTGTALWLYHRWQQKEVLPEAALPVIDPRPPEVIAYAELDRIAALDLPAQNQLKEHYSLVTDCLRRYIEGRYQIPALEQTTAELKTAFLMGMIPSELARKFLELLQEGDLVKFARYRPLQQEAYTLLDSARAVVRVTTPVPAPQEPEREPEVTS